MKSIFIALLCLLNSAVAAQDLYMVRSEQSFPEAMVALQEAITAKGYTISRVQRVDIGLTASGYKTDKYRVVFFGKFDEVRDMTSKHLFLAPYMPLKIAIFAEGDNTIILAPSFKNLSRYSDEPDVSESLARWETDVASILEMVRLAK